jgi:hypothetical protein
MLLFNSNKLPSSVSSQMLRKVKINYSLPLWCRWDFRSSRMLRRRPIQTSESLRVTIFRNTDCRHTHSLSSMCLCKFELKRYVTFWLLKVEKKTKFSVYYPRYIVYRLSRHRARKLCRIGSLHPQRHYVTTAVFRTHYCNHCGKWCIIYELFKLPYPVWLFVFLIPKGLYIVC